MTRLRARKNDGRLRCQVFTATGAQCSRPAAGNFICWQHQNVGHPLRLAEDRSGRCRFPAGHEQACDLVGPAFPVLFSFTISPVAEASR